MKDFNLLTDGKIEEKNVQPLGICGRGKPWRLLMFWTAGSAQL